MSEEDYDQGFAEGYYQGLSTDKEKSFLILAARIDELKKENAKLRAALNDIEAYVEGRVITHRDIAELAESSMSGKKQRVRMSEAADILGKIRAAAAASKETGDE